MPKDDLLDPHDKAVSQSMKSIDSSDITDVRIGKHIQLFVDAEDKTTAIAKVEEAYKKSLANQVME